MEKEKGYQTPLNVLAAAGAGGTAIYRKKNRKWFKTFKGQMIRQDVPCNGEGFSDDASALACSGMVGKNEWLDPGNNW